MPIIRLMCLLFSDDLTVTDRIPLCSLPTRLPQDSEFQETASDRSDSRETEDGGLSGTENNRSFLLFSLHSPFHLQHLLHASMLKLFGTDLEMEKKIRLYLSSAEGKNNFDF